MTLAATASGTPPYTYAWTIDGAARERRDASSLHLADGNHTVTLVVRDGIGASASVTKTRHGRDAARRADPEPVRRRVGGSGRRRVVRRDGLGVPRRGRARLLVGLRRREPRGLRRLGDPRLRRDGPVHRDAHGDRRRGSVATRDARDARDAADAVRRGPLPAGRPRDAGRGRQLLHVRGHDRLAPRAPVDVLLTYTASVGGGSGYARLDARPRRAAGPAGDPRLAARPGSADPGRDVDARRDAHGDVLGHGLDSRALPRRADVHGRSVGRRRNVRSLLPLGADRDRHAHRLRAPAERRPALEPRAREHERRPDRAPHRLRRSDGPDGLDGGHRPRAVRAGRRSTRRSRAAPPRPASRSSRAPPAREPSRRTAS